MIRQFYKMSETYFDQIRKKKSANCLLWCICMFCFPLCCILFDSCNCSHLVVGPAAGKGPFCTNEKSWAKDASWYARQWGWYTLPFKESISSLNIFASSYSNSCIHIVLISLLNVVYAVWIIVLILWCS